MNVLQTDRPFHDVDDPRAHTRHALNDELRSRGATLAEDRYEDCLGQLLVVLCRLSQRYDPSKGPSFSTWSYSILRRRYTDWLRKSRGDARYGLAGLEETMADVGAGGAAAVTEDASGFEALVDAIDHDRLSSRARGALRTIARSMAEDGLTATEAAQLLGKSRREAAADLGRLRLELAS